MKRTFNLILVLMATTLAMAAPVSRQDAKKAAAEFMAAHGMKLSPVVPSYRAPRKGSASQDDYYYIFNSDDGKGYVIISGDDRTEQVLGYSDEGTFDPNNIPENMHAWLDWYALAIKIVSESSDDPNASPAKAQRRISPAKRAISPLIKSRWNQGGPYNILVPFTTNSDGSLTTNHCATGCVATALAQVMYYYRWPEATIARIPQHTTIGDQVIPFVKANTQLKWDLMQDTYNGTNNTPQDTAVAELMLYVGQALKMGYGPSSGAGHGENVPYLMKRFFDYDDSGWCASRGNYTLEEWEDLIYNELFEGRPVSGSGGGHAYVVDGYDGNGLFHVNWGWGGSSDGYFLIDVMNPGDGRGIGAGTVDGGYPVGNAMISIKPRDDVEDPQYPHPSFLGCDIDGTNVIARVCNWTGNTAVIDAGLAYQDRTGNLTIIGSTKHNTHTVNIYYTYSFPVSSLPRGTWKITPVAKVSTDPEWHPQFDFDTKWIEAKVEGGKVELSWHDPVNGLNVDSIFVTGTLKKDDRQLINVTFSQTMEEFQGDIHAFVCHADSTEMRKVNTTYISCDSKASRTFAFPFTPAATGTYNIYIATDGDGKNIIGNSSVEIYSTSHLYNQLTLSSFAVNNGAQGTQDTYIFGHSAMGKIVVKNNNKTKPYDGVVKVTIWQAPDPDKNLYWTMRSVSNYVHIDPSGSIDIPFKFDGLEKGPRYGFSVDNVTQNSSLRGLFGYGVVTDGIIYYRNTGVTWATEPKESILVRNYNYAIDLRLAPGVKTIDDRTNTNAIYILAEGADVPEGIEGKNIIIGDVAENITITDEEPFVSPIDFEAKKITYKRTIAKNSDGKNAWEGLTLPFEPNTISADGQILKLKTSDDGDGQVAVKTFVYVDDSDVMTFDYSDRIEANLPYVVSLPEGDFNVAGKELSFEAENAIVSNTLDVLDILGTRSYNFCGTFLQKDLSDIYTLNAEGTAFEPVAEASVNQFRTYVTTSLSEAKRDNKIYIVESEETGISSVNADVNVNDNKVYDLQGRRMKDATLKKGVYIVDGKKVVVK